MDGVVFGWYETASNYAARLEAIDVLMTKALLIERNGDNVEAKVPIDVWRQMAELARGT